MQSVIRAEVEINASASKVWALLTDFERYHEWNPFITQISGELLRGKRLALHMQAPDMNPLRAEAKVLEATPVGKLAVSCLSAPTHTEHQVVLEPTKKGVKVIQLQRFDGEADSGRGVHDRIQLGMEMMNAALKARAER